MATFEIPLTPQAQVFQIELAKVIYTMTLLWCNGSNTWVLNIADRDGVPIVRGIPLVANTNLLEQYDYLNFGGKLVALTDDDPSVPPTYPNLGLAGRVYFITS